MKSNSGAAQAPIAGGEGIPDAASAGGSNYGSGLSYFDGKSGAQMFARHCSTKVTSGNHEICTTPLPPDRGPEEVATCGDQFSVPSPPDAHSIAQSVTESWSLMKMRLPERTG